MEQEVLFKNPHLKQLFRNSEFVFEKPEVINEVSFEKKELVEDHILFCGDSAGMITPLCGNGMAMAIHSGKTLADCIINNGKVINASRRLELEKHYVKCWENRFSLRLQAGRNIQKLFLNLNFSNMAVRLLRSSSILSNLMIRSTHGESF
jgi:flavin-dependent dehydrogenase